MMTGRAVGRSYGLVSAVRSGRVELSWPFLFELLKNIAGSRFTPMAIEAPAHGERCRLMDAVHRLHIPVAAFACDAFGDVALVREINEVRKLVNSDPLD